MIALLLACTSSAPPTLSVDAEASAAAIDALCKLFEGASRPCERQARGVVGGGQTIGVEARTLPDEKSLGIVSVRGVVDLRTGDDVWSTRLTGFGGNRGEALQRATHEWAVVSAVAVADLVLDPGARPALMALEPDASGDLTLAGRPVLRGWTLTRPNLTIEHTALLRHLDGAFADRVPSGVITFEGVRQGGALTLECWSQGEPDPALCDVARGWVWPAADHELRLAYLVVPSR